jgi:dienelactone hydrolase
MTGGWGMVVLHDGFGIDEAVRAQSGWLSGAGYLALSVDLGFRAVISVPAEDVP